MVNLERLNQSIFQGNSKPWELVLCDILNQVQWRASFLSLKVPDPISAHWNLPPYIPSLHSRRSTNHTNNCKLLIIPFEDSTVGAQRCESGSIVWAKTFLGPDIFSAATFFMHEALMITSSIHLRSNSSKLRHGILDPSTSPWHFHFQARKATALFFSIKASFNLSQNMIVDQWARQTQAAVTLTSLSHGMTLDLDTGLWPSYFASPPCPSRLYFLFVFCCGNGRQTAFSHYLSQLSSACLFSVLFLGPGCELFFPDPGCGFLLSRALPPHYFEQLWLLLWFSFLCPRAVGFCLPGLWDFCHFESLPFPARLLIPVLFVDITIFCLP